MEPCLRLESLAQCEDPDDFAGPIGDRHLRTLAKPYGRAVGSGIDAVRDTNSHRDSRRAADAFAYLGLPDLAEMFRRLADDRSEVFGRLGVPALERAFQRVLQSPEGPVVPAHGRRLGPLSSGPAWPWTLYDEHLLDAVGMTSVRVPRLLQ